MWKAQASRSQERATEPKGSSRSTTPWAISNWIANYKAIKMYYNESFLLALGQTVWPNWQFLCLIYAFLWIIRQVRPRWLILPVSLTQLYLLGFHAKIGKKSVIKAVDQAKSAFFALEEMKFTLQYSYKLNLYNAAHTKYLKALYIKNTWNKNLQRFWTWNWEVSLKIKLKSSFFFFPQRAVLTLQFWCLIEVNPTINECKKQKAKPALKGFRLN